MMKISNFKFLISNFITHPLFSGSAIMILGSNSVNVLNYLYHFIMARLLGPAGYGELVSLISLIGLLGTVPVSISLTMIKSVSSAKTTQEVVDLANFLKAKVFQVSLFFFILIALTSPLTASFLKIDKVAYIILIALTFLFSLPALLNRSILQGLLKFKEMILTVFIENSGKLLFSVGLIFIGFQVGGALISFALAAILGWILSDLYLKTYYSAKKTSKTVNIKPMIIFTIPVILQTIATTSLYSSDVVLVKHFFSSYDSGLYAALSTMGKIIFFGTGPIGAVMFPLVSKRKSTGQNFSRIFIYSLFLTGFLAATLLAIYWLFPKFAIGLLYGSAYLEASNLLIWFGVFMGLFALANLFITFNLSLGKTGVVTLPLAAALTQVLLIWFFHGSLYAVIIISIIVTALLLLALIIYSNYSKNGDQVNFNNRSGI